MQDDLAAQLTALSPAVLAWVAWMMVCGFASVLFAGRHRSARVALLVFVLTIVLGSAIFVVSRNIHLTGIAHLVLWIPLLIYLLQREVRTESFDPRSAYGVWIGLLMATMVVSLLFDVRDIILVSTGAK
jgi:hypothetical protein